MTYRIEITADTLTELAGKTLALATQLNASAACPVMPEVAAAVLTPVKAQARKTTAAPAPEPVAEDADPVSQIISEPVAEVIEDAVIEPVAEEAPAPAPEPAPAAEPTGVSFQDDIMPGVIEVVTKRGKPVMAEILSGFGVAKASQLDAARYPELLDAIRDALGGA